MNGSVNSGSSSSANKGTTATTSPVARSRGSPTAIQKWSVHTKEAPKTSNVVMTTAPIYARMQAVVQSMLQTENGVPIRSHKRRLISAIPCAFTGADVVNWIMKHLHIQTKAEAIHLANLLSQHGFYFSVEGTELPVKDDGTLYRFQTPYYWPSQNPSDGDIEYGVYLVKQVLKSKHRIRLLDYELNNLHKLKLRLAKEWRTIAEKADTDVKIFGEQKRIAKAIITSQEEAFWRQRRPPPGETSVSDATLTRLCSKRPEAYMDEGYTVKLLRAEFLFLQYSSKRTRIRLSTSLESTLGYCQRYKDFDPMLTSPFPNNPWISNESTLWTLDKSLLEHPTERQAKKWACSFHDLLTDVTGRFMFEEFCKSQFCHENVRFWQACRDLKSIPLSALQGSVKLIYDEYLQRGSRNEVNISANVQDEVERDIITPSRFAFMAAQEQIYHLMQNDIYPRFLKSAEYQAMLKKGKELQLAEAKGFFAKFQYGNKNKKLEANLKDATDISPCLPQRYARRQLSISRKMSGSAGLGSLDDLALGKVSSYSDIISQSKRRSECTEAFIDTLINPGAGQSTTDATKLKVRRVSAPDQSNSRQSFSRISSGGSQLDSVFEADESRRKQDIAIFKGSITMETLPMSYSADDLKQLLEDSDNIGPSKWKKLGLTAGIDLNADPLSPGPKHDVPKLTLPNGEGGETQGGGVLHSSKSVSHNLKEQATDILKLPTFTLGTSPNKTGAFEFESIKSSSLLGSTESIHSTSSH